MKSILCKRASLLSPCVSRVSLANLCPIIQACFLSTSNLCCRDGEVGEVCRLNKDVSPLLSLAQRDSTYNRKTFSNNIYSTLKRFITQNPINSGVQEKIESFLYNQCSEYFDYKKSVSKFPDIFGNGFSKLLLEKRLSLIKYLDLRRTSGKPLKRGDDLMLFKILNTVDMESVSNAILWQILEIINKRDKDYTYNSVLKVTMGIGSSLHNLLLFHLYQAAKEEDKELTFSKWKRISSEYREEGYETLHASLGGKISEILVDINVLQTSVVTDMITKNKINVYIVTDELIDVIGEQRFTSLPLKLPMIVKPKPYSNDVLGGYLLNDHKYTDNLFIDKFNLKQKTSVIDEKMYYIINYISGVPFQINKDVLRFVDIYGDRFGLISSEIPIKEFKDKPKLTKNQRLQLDSLQSKFELERNILGIADVYQDVPEFYIPVRMDSRGRVYCISTYLNYQSSELAKSLLLFSRGERISLSDKRAFEWLAIYGANCFGNKIDKKSFSDRISWVRDNLENILDVENGVLLAKADSKCLFTAFCLEYRRYINTLKHSNTGYFITNLPIQLDATCNAYQHLALLTNDHKMATHTNLGVSTWADAPIDLYSFVGDRLKIIFDDIYRKSEDFELREQAKRIISVTLKRAYIKSAIMTYVYNASLMRMGEYIKEGFKAVEKEGKVLFYSNTDISDIGGQHKDIPYLEYKDFMCIAKTIKKCVHDEFPKIKGLSIYLAEIASIMTDLNLPIPWAVPSGVRISQSYVKTRQHILKPFSFSTKSITLRVRDDSGLLNKRKQITALMPNLIHSLDAASLALLVHNFQLKTVNNNSVYTVHDCFAVTANQVDVLVETIKNVYITIYSENKYLEQFDRNIRDFIKMSYKDVVFEGGYIHIEDKTFKFPNINFVTGKEIDVYKNIPLSSYLVS